MKIVITGGLGFIGIKLAIFFLDRGYRVISLDLPPHQTIINHANFEYISADTTREGSWQEVFKDIDAVVNLAGTSIFTRWNKTYKDLIYTSRILTTRNVVKSLPESRSITLISTSAVGYYGNRNNDVLKESEPPGDDFLAVVCKDWEREAFRALDKGIRVVATRFGVVLGKNGGILAKMIPLFRYCIGGPLGSGMHWFSWVHMDDLLSAIMFVLENKAINGSINLCAPNPVRNIDFAKTLGHMLNRPACMPAPACILRLVMGEFGKFILNSQRAIPDKLLKPGFEFQYPGIKEAFREVLT